MVGFLPRGMIHRCKSWYSLWSKGKLPHTNTAEERHSTEIACYTVIANKIQTYSGALRTIFFLLFVEDIKNSIIEMAPLAENSFFVENISLIIISTKLNEYIHFRYGCLLGAVYDCSNCF